MIEQLGSVMKQNGPAQGATDHARCLSDRLHRLAAYGALALIAGIVFGTGALPPL
ncbi:hypothetical protein [Tardiphaga sp.]|jgi:hypothetical protein|uniref:hypothetical protein n=1 Tax=Tardiphaga sp. TaxID=1926292 RepID=UPI0037DA428D